MNRLKHKTLALSLRKARVRRTVIGSASRPRLSVSITKIHVSAQVIDDAASKTLVAATTVGSKQTGSLSQKAAFIGNEIAKKVKKAKINQLVFDRNGRQYAGRLNSLLEEIRKEGIEV